MSTRAERFDEKVVAAVPNDGGVRDATEIWEMLGGRWDWTGLLMGPGITRVMQSLDRLAVAGRIREQRVERAPGRFHRIYDRPVGTPGS